MLWMKQELTTETRSHQIHQETGIHLSPPDHTQLDEGTDNQVPENAAQRTSGKPGEPTSTKPSAWQGWVSRSLGGMHPPNPEADTLLQRP
jgi:hypothetical protein